MATIYTSVRVSTTGSTAYQDNSTGVEVITDAPTAADYDGVQVILDTTNNICTLFASDGSRKIFEQGADITISIQGS